MSDEKIVNKENKIISSAIFTSFLKYGVNIVSGLVFYIFTARFFGSEIIGIFAFLMMFIGIFGILTNFAEQGGFIRVLNKYQQDSPHAGALCIVFFVMTFLITAILAMPALLLGKYIIVDIYHKDIFPYFAILLVSYLLFTNTAAILNSIYAAYQQIKYPLIAEIAIFIAKISAFVCVYFCFTKSITSFVGLQVLIDITSCVFMLVFVGKVINLNIPWSKEIFKTAYDDFKEALIFGLKLLPKNTNYLITEYTDRAVIPLYLPISALGIYYVVYQIFSKLATMDSIFSRMLYPSLSRLFYGEKFEELITIYRETQIKVLVFMGLACALVCGFSTTILGIFGEEFSKGTIVLGILVLGILINVFSTLPSTLITAMNKPLFVSFTMCIVAVVNFVLNIVLIPKIGLEGAAWANTAGLLIGAVIFNVAFARLGVCLRQDAVDHIGRHFLHQIHCVVHIELFHHGFEFTVGKAANQRGLLLRLHLHKGFRRQLLGQQPKYQRQGLITESGKGLGHVGRVEGCEKIAQRRVLFPIGQLDNALFEQQGFIFHRASSLLGFVPNRSKTQLGPSQWEASRRDANRFRPTSVPLLLSASMPCCPPFSRKKPRR